MERQWRNPRAPIAARMRQSTGVAPYERWAIDPTQAPYTSDYTSSAPLRAPFRGSDKGYPVRYEGPVSHDNGSYPCEPMPYGAMRHLGYGGVEGCAPRLRDTCGPPRYFQESVTPPSFGAMGRHDTRNYNYGHMDGRFAVGSVSSDRGRAGVERATSWRSHSTAIDDSATRHFPSSWTAHSDAKHMFDVDTTAEGSSSVLSASEARSFPSRASGFELFPPLEACDPAWASRHYNTMLQTQAPLADPTRQEMVMFRLHQWQLFRVLLLRRYAGVTGRKEDAMMIPMNIAAALRHFDLPTTAGQLLSRPYKYHSVQEAAGSKVHGRRGGLEEANDEAFLQFVDRSELPLPSDTPISRAEIEAINALNLQEKALGYNPFQMTKMPGPALHEAPGLRRPGPVNSLSIDVRAPVGPETALPSTKSHSSAGSRGLDMNAMAAIAADLVSSRRHKTKLCHAFQRGRCPRGERCDYAHGEHELRIMHDTSDAKYKIKLCRVWLDSCGVYCNYGSKCSYAHGVHELRVVPEQDRLLADSYSAFSPKSTSTSGAPPRAFKSSLCKRWLEHAAAAIKDAAAEHNLKAFRLDAHGSGCAAADRCPYAHGLAELRLPSAEESQWLLNMVLRGPGSLGVFSRSTSGSEYEDINSVGVSSHDSPTAVAGRMDGLSNVEQFLLLVASCLMVPVLPPTLVQRVTLTAAGATAGPAALRAEFADMPPAMAKALAIASSNPILPIALSAKQHIEAPRTADLARIVAIMGYDASNAALALASSAMESLEPEAAGIPALRESFDTWSLLTGGGALPPYALPLTPSAVQFTPHLPALHALSTDSAASLLWAPQSNPSL